MANMQKLKKHVAKLSNYSHNTKTLKPGKPLVGYGSMPIVKDFDYKAFKKLTEKIPLLQKDWSQILHISERTLQRYAKDNGVFNFSVVDRILQIDKVVKRGTEVFGNPEKFINWLKINPPVLEGHISIYSLASIDGINSVMAQITRIEHGVLA